MSKQGTNKFPAAEVPTVEPEAAAVVVEDAKIGEPVDLAAEVAQAWAGEVAHHEAVTAAVEQAEDTVPSSDAVVEVGAIVTPGGAVIPPPFDSPAEIEPPDPDDVVRATREYGDLLERGYMDHEALAVLRPSGEAA